MYTTWKQKVPVREEGWGQQERAEETHRNMIHICDMEAEGAR